MFEEPVADSLGRLSITSVPPSQFDMNQSESI